MELEKIVLRALLTYIFLLASIRLSGKRTLSHGTPFDFVLALIVGDLIDNAIWGTAPFAQFVVGAGTLVVAKIVISLVSSSSPALQRFLQGEPAVFMRSGRLSRRGLRGEIVNEQEAMEMLRLAEGLEPGQHGQVKSARIEPSGYPSVILHDWARPAQQIDLQAVKDRKKAGEQ